jgi:hypothetical protein
MVKRILVLSTVAVALLGSIHGSAGAAPSSAVRAELEHSRIREGEPVRLILRSHGDADGEVPDLAPLEQDFEILGTQQSQRLQITNGRAESSRDWIVTLMPKRKGPLQIPAIRTGDTVTEPLPLTVADAAPPPSRSDAPDVFVEAEVDESSPYVQGEVRYTVRVFDGVGMLEGSLDEPKAADLRVSPLGETRTYETRVNGRPYRVHERQYAVSPLRSGEIIIPGLTLEARVPGRQGRRGGDPFGSSLFEEMFGADPFAGFPGGGIDPSFMDGFFDRGQGVRVRSNPISLSVRARPGDASRGWFLPAREVELIESLAPEHPDFRVGEVVRRTVTLRALGASSEQLPRFEIPEVDGVRIYDEGSRDLSAPSDEGTVAVLERTVGIMPTRAGAVTLPAIEVEWFDVAAGEKRIASLPARTIDVRPAGGQAAARSAAVTAQAADPAAPAAAKASVAAAPQPAAPAPAAPAQDAKLAAAPDAAAAVPTPAGAPERGFAWPLVAPIAFVLGACLTALLARRSGSAAPLPAAATASGAATRRRLARELHRACDAGDARAARELLVRWSRATSLSGAALTPTALADRLRSSRLKAAVRDLDRAIYGRDGDAWRGTELWQAFREASRSDDPKAEERSGLRALYPDLTGA